MAFAEIEYVCSECGQTATRRVKKYNSREAREYEEWFKSQPGHICPGCYAKHRREDLCPPEDESGDAFKKL